MILDLKGNIVSPDALGPKVITDSEGNQIFSTNQPYGYRQILRQMYNKEKDLREQESLIVNNEDVTLRWNDVFKKFCKSA